jgi:hypothetical protein
VNDSTALLFIFRYEKYEIDNRGDIEEALDVSLNLVDITREKIYWSRKVDVKSKEMGWSWTDVQSLRDSVLLFHSLNVNINNRNLRSVSMWKLGESRYNSVGIEWIGKEWESLERPRLSFHPWQGNSILVNAKYRDKDSGHDVSDYVLVDVSAQIARPFETPGFEWLEGCSDFRWGSTGVLCLKELPEEASFVLLKNGVESLAVRRVKPPLSIGKDSKSEPVFCGSSIISNGWMYLVDEQGQVSEEPLNVWVSYSSSRAYGSAETGCLGYDMSAYYNLNDNESVHHTARYFKRIRH